ncbi:hypothetical protein CRG98_010687 [Punica granatum]|uniref:Serpin domain-containing protein n=1 Tax=Punica granatum TaxID=22663 RepID=A0A2I0KKB0_PUNGR|nr:hypothetical protein CRG98_010687 [Punica granatum]
MGSGSSAPSPSPSSLPLKRLWTSHTGRLPTLPISRPRSDFHLHLALRHAVKVSGQVNSWVEKATNILIKESQEFDPSKTKDAEFHLLNGSHVQVPFMTSENNQKLRAFDEFKVLELPYKYGRDERSFGVYFYLPNTKDGLPYLVERVCSEPGFLDRHLPQRKVEVGYFRIPRFKISFGFEASEVLKKLGVAEPFVGGLTEMVDSVEGQCLIERLPQVHH